MRSLLLAFAAVLAIALAATGAIGLGLLVTALTAASSATISATTEDSTASVTGSLTKQELVTGS